MIDKKEMLILANLRNNARETLTKMSRKTSIPVSTIFVKTTKEYRDKLRQHLLLDKSLNSVYKINNGYDFMLDGIFRQIKDVEQFLEKLENEFGITDKYVYYIVDEIKKEDFLSSPEYVKLI